MGGPWRPANTEDLISYMNQSTHHYSLKHSSILGLFCSLAVGCGRMNNDFLFPAAAQSGSGQYSTPGTGRRAHLRPAFPLAAVPLHSRTMSALKTTP